MRLSLLASFLLFVPSLAFAQSDASSGQPKAVSSTSTAVDVDNFCYANGFSYSQGWRIKSADGSSLECEEPSNNAISGERLPLVWGVPQ
jgi:hypothetical protein